MTFKEQIAKDNRNVFMNQVEFAETHMINDKEMPCMIDNNELIDREKRYQYKKSLYADGIYLKQLLIYVLAKDFGPLPAIGRTIRVNKRSYIVADAIDEDGMYSLCLEANKT